MSRLLDFARSYVFLSPGKPITFAGRPYLDAVYAADHRDIVLRCSRQVEKSTFLCNSILFELATRRNAAICYVAPRMQQSYQFAKMRLLRTLESSPLLRRKLLGRGKTVTRLSDMQFRNGSVLHIRSCFQSADAVRGLSLTSLYVDEFQDIATGILPVMQEAMSHAKDARTVIAGTPKVIDNHLETIYGRSTQDEWTIRCEACQRENTLQLQNLGTHSVICAGCQMPIDAKLGRWISKNPGANWRGFWINHAMVPWINFPDILTRRNQYDEVLFKNEVFGLPTVLGDHVVSLAELEATCGNFPMLRGFQDIPNEAKGRLVAGIDWGAGGAAQTAVCVGYMDRSRRFVIVFFARFRGREDPKIVIEGVAKICRDFQVASIGADAGHGHVNNRLLHEQYAPRWPLTAIRYGASDSTPTADGLFHTWTVDRTKSISHLISCAKGKHLIFPKYSVTKPFLEEIACEIAVYDDERRTIRYTHPPNTQDDILHACNYALRQGRRIDASIGGGLGDDGYGAANYITYDDHGMNSRYEDEY